MISERELNYYQDYTDDCDTVFSALNCLLTDLTNETVIKEIESVIDMLHMNLDGDYEFGNIILQQASNEQRRFENTEYWNSKL